MTWGVLSLAWVSGSESILSVAYQATALSEADLLAIRLLRTVAFLGGTGWGLYVLLGWQPAAITSNTLQTRTILDVSPVGLALTEGYGLFRYANPVFLRLLDLGSGVVGQVDLESVLRGRSTSGIAGLLSGTGRGDAVVRIRYASGRESEVQLIVTRIAATENEGFLVVATDITATQRVSANTALYNHALDALQAGVFISDATRPGLPIVSVNAAFQRMSGYDTAELVGAGYALLQGVDRDQPGAIQLAEAIGRQQAATVKLRNHRKSGEMFWAELTVSPIFDQGGHLTHFVGWQQDITNDRRESARLAGELYDDAITSGLSRAGFVRGFCALLEDTANAAVLLVRIDLQSFHEFNTALGWDVGDTLLEEVASRLRRAVPGQVVGRLESNQFGVALPVTPHEAPARVELIRAALQGRYILPGTSCEPVIAIGWTVGPVGAGYRQLMQQSSVALAEARARRTGVTRKFDAEMESRIVERRRLTTELKQAIRDQDFLVYYQPKVELETGKIVAAEALMRWNHPLFGLQWPARFVTLAEETGLIIEIGEISLVQAAEVAAEINRGRSSAIPISVNVSLAQFRRGDFVRVIENALAGADASPAWLELELTENIYTAASSDIGATLHRIRAMGVGLTIDDFATSYSSLQYLADEPVDEIKIDRSFVNGLAHDDVARAVIKSILSLAQAKVARVTAEAVETEQQRQILLELGCVLGQGYLFSPPLPRDDFLALLARDAALPEQPSQEAA